MKFHITGRHCGEAPWMPGIWMEMKTLLKE
jgi:hypothetical protein